MATLSEGMDGKFECLRVGWMAARDGNGGSVGLNDGEKYLLASAGADGVVRLWSACQSEDDDKLEWKCVGTQSHYEYEQNDNDEEVEPPQIYSMQFIQSKSAPHLNLLLTSANDAVYIWKIENDVQSTNNDNVPNKRLIQPHLFVQFERLDPNSGAYVNQFGGPRNPLNELYVFEASYSECNDLVGAALSDGTCRVVSLANHKNNNTTEEDDEMLDDNNPLQRGQCVLSLPPDYFPEERGGHLTALSWDESGTRLATCIASGRVVLWMIQTVRREDGLSFLHPTCVAVLEGGEMIL